MKEDIQAYLKRYDEKTNQRFAFLSTLIYESISRPIEEKLWANLPTFSSGSNFIRLIPFKDHINIEAKTVLLFQGELSRYKITPKGMLQIFHHQEIPTAVLKKVFQESMK